ncbi:MAG: hypothetical protein NVSMB12_21960 [Acidimicrobiales bacterium]
MHTSANTVNLTRFALAPDMASPIPFILRIALRAPLQPSGLEMAVPMPNIVRAFAHFVPQLLPPLRREMRHACGGHGWIVASDGRPSTDVVRPTARWYAQHCCHGRHVLFTHFAVAGADSAQI